MKTCTKLRKSRGGYRVLQVSQRRDSPGKWRSWVFGWLFDMHDDTLGNLIRSFRIRAGLSQNRLAEQARISKWTLTDLERGSRNRARLSTLEQLVSGLELEGSDAERLRSFATRVAGQFSCSKVSAQSAWSRIDDRLIGREVVLESASAVLDEARALALCGIGGAGKTRVAETLFRRLAEGDSDRAFYLHVESGFDPERVCAALGRHRPKLVVLDFARDSAGVDLVVRSARKASERVIVVNRRAPDDLAERAVLVGPLQLADAASLVQTRLEYAGRPPLSDSEAERIARSVDCFPQAIEYAVRRLVVVGVDRFLALNGADPSDVAHRAVAETIEDLPAPERRLLSAVAVLPAAFDRAILDMLADRLGARVPSAVDTLERRGALLIEDGAPSSRRVPYLMRRVLQSSRDKVDRAATVSLFLDREHERIVRARDVYERYGQIEEVSALAGEASRFESVFDAALGENREDVVVDLAALLETAMPYVHGYPLSLVLRTTRALVECADAERIAPVLRARAHELLGWRELREGKAIDARRSFARSVELADENELTSTAARAHLGIARIELAAGACEDAIRRAQEALTVAASSDASAAMDALLVSACAHSSLGDHPAASREIGRARALSQALGAPAARRWANFRALEVALAREDRVAASDALEELRDQEREKRTPLGAVLLRLGHAKCALARADFGGAVQAFADTLEGSSQVGRLMIVDCLEGIASCAEAVELRFTAGFLAGIAAAERRRMLGRGAIFPKVPSPQSAPGYRAGAQTSYDDIRPDLRKYVAQIAASRVASIDERRS